MKKYLAICTFLLLFNSFSRAQLIISDNSTPVEIQTSVLQLDQFIGRFNYQLDFLNKPVTDEFRDQYSRELTISLLLNQEDKRFDSTSTFDQKYVDAVNEFIKNVVDNKLTLKRNDKLYAKLQSKFLYQEKSINITLLMQYHYHGENAYSWMIVDAYSKEFDFPGEQEISKYIPPNNDEMGFMYLQRAFEDADNLGNYADTASIQNQLPIVMYLISSGKMKFQEVKEYHYLHYGIKGWCIEIKNYQREGLNTGWLIGEVYKDDGEKPCLK